MTKTTTVKRVKKPAEDTCHFCGQPITTETYVKFLRENGLPSLAKVLEMISLKSPKKVKR